MRPRIPAFTPLELRRPSCEDVPWDLRAFVEREKKKSDLGLDLALVTLRDEERFRDPPGGGGARPAGQRTGIA